MKWGPHILQMGQQMTELPLLRVPMGAHLELYLERAAAEVGWGGRTLQTQRAGSRALEGMPTLLRPGIRLRLPNGRCSPRGRLRLVVLEASLLLSPLTCLPSR